jgi:hypothetical protein
VCRNIRPLFNYEPPVTEDEVRAAAQQFVRKVSGTNKPSKSNEKTFEQAIEEITASVQCLLANMVSHAPPKDRQQELAKARARNYLRFTRN